MDFQDTLELKETRDLFKVLGKGHVLIGLALARKSMVIIIILFSEGDNLRLVFQRRMSHWRGLKVPANYFFKEKP